jgi:hypothetical protein
MTVVPVHRGAPAILYGAKSTQDRHRSLVTQLEDACEFAEENDWKILAEYKDEGFSAYSGNRGPGLAQPRCMLRAPPRRQTCRARSWRRPQTASRVVLEMPQVPPNT